MSLTDEDVDNLESYLGMTTEEALETYSQEWLDLNEKSIKVVMFVYDQAVQKPEETTAAEETAATTAAESSDENAAAETKVEETTAVETTAAEVDATVEEAETTAAETTTAQ